MTVEIPKDAVFESAAKPAPEKAVKSSFTDAIHLEGNSSKGEVVEYLKFDETEGKFAHELRQDVEPTLDWVKAQHLHQGSQVGKSKSGEWYHAARVPTVVLHAWLNRMGLTMRDFKGDVVDKFLNDSENAAFRVWQGRA
jgi:hypothetical protein